MTRGGSWRARWRPGSSTASTRGGSRPRCAGGPRPVTSGSSWTGTAGGRARRAAIPVDAYRVGAAKLDEVLAWCVDLGIPAVTLWACSTENLGRAPEELRGLLSVIENKLNAIATDPRIHRRRIRVRAVGKLDLLPDSTLAAIRRAEQATEGYGDAVLTFALAYGGRQEIADAVRRLVRDRAKQGGTLDEIIDAVTQEEISRYPLRAGSAGPRPDHPDVRRGAALRVPPLAERLQRVLLLRRALARVPQDRFPPRHPELPAARPALRRVSPGRRERGRVRRAVPRILILSAPYGAGHARAAEAVARAFADEGAQVEVLDHFVSFLPPAFVRASLAMFWGMLRFAPGLWGLAYEFSARIGPRSPAMAGMDRIGAKACCAIWSGAPGRGRAHPSDARRRHGVAPGSGRDDLPHAIVFTDFSAHPQWIHAGLERYFVPTEAVRAGVVAQGIAADRVVASGLPVDASFVTPPDRAGAPGGDGARRRTVPVVLVTGGMRGLLRGVAEACEALASLERPFVALAVCGDHLRLAARLRRRHWRDARFRVLGRVTDMARVMGVADLVVSKAGAMTCAEALALGRPLLLHRSLPGQEQANEAGLVAAGAALRARRA